MTDVFDQWLPFRRQGAAPAGDEVGSRIRREVIQPLEVLLARVTEPGSEIPGELKESLEAVLATVSESFAATDSAGNVETLEHAWQGWELKLQAFARDGGEIGMQRLGKPPPVSGEPARQLFLAVREAIGNAMRHAAARRIEVLLVPWKDGCAVTVADNGRGMAASKAGGIGLTTMRRRMARCGGELLLHPADGTVVEFRLPRPSFDLWRWLCDSGRLARGVDEAHAAALVRRLAREVGPPRVVADRPGRPADRRDGHRPADPR
jgi:signal transduction histidine kinase